MPRIFGIDLGSHSVKLAIYEGSFGKVELTDYRLRALPQEDGDLPDFQGRIAALGELMADADAARGAVVGCTFPAEQATVRLIRLPFGDRDQVEKALAFEVENQVPFDLEDMLVVPRVLQVKAGDSRVLTVIAAREKVGALLRGLAGIKVDPRVLALDADLLGAFASNSGATAVVDVGHSRTLLTLCVDGQPVASRAIQTGGAALTSALVRHLGLGWGEAEGLKHVADLSEGTHGGPTLAQAEWEPDGAAESEWGEASTNPGVQGQAAAPRDLAAMTREAARVLRTALASLTAELRASLIGFEDLHEVEVEELVLVGGTSGLAGLPAFWTAALGVPIRLGQVSKRADQLGDPGRFALAHAVGAKVGAGSRGRVMDLRREEFAFKGDLALVGTIARYGAAAMVLFVLGGSIWFAFRMVQVNRQIDALDIQIKDTVVATFPDVSPDRLKDTSTALAIMTERTAATTDQVATLGSLISDVPPTLETLRQLSRAMPKPEEARVDIKELTITASTISMKAESDGFEQAGRIESSLQAVDRFHAATRGDEKKAKGGEVNFTVTIPLDQTSAEEG